MTTGKKNSPSKAGIYFHIPLCESKCPYCHFFSVTSSKKTNDRFFLALLEEWRQKETLIKNYLIDTVYLGGGTPLLLEDKQIKLLLTQVYRQNLAKNTEITIEARPQDISKERVAALKSMGINRLSLGAQSFIDEELQILGRKHTSLQTIKAIELAKNAGIDNISIDLMYDLPFQTVAKWRMTLAAVLNLPITHISLYNLEIWPKTAFYRKKKDLQLPSEKVSLQLLKNAIAAFRKMGLIRYEISAFAKKGYESRHNTGYWTGKPFFGLGPSSSSYLNGERSANTANLQSYAKRLQNHQTPVDFSEKLEYPANTLELLAVALRLTKGINITRFQKEHGALPAEVLDFLKKSPLADFKKRACKLSKKGLLFYDSLAEELISIKQNA